MAYLKFLDSNELHNVKVTKSDNIVTISFTNDKIVSTAGFNLYLDSEGTKDIGGDAYHAYTTIYRNDDTTEKYNGYQLSSDGSVYVEVANVITPEYNLEHGTIPTQQYVTDRQLIEELTQGILELSEIVSELKTSSTNDEEVK